MGQSGNKLRVLFLCTGNSCRSQMAEGWARALKSEELDAYSAGTNPGTLNPIAVSVMAESGVDISGQYSKGLEDIAGKAFDIVVTVCDGAKQACPSFPGQSKVVHVGFADPPELACRLTDAGDVLAIYRRVRDEIKQFVVSLPGCLDGSKQEISGE